MGIDDEALAEALIDLAERLGIQVRVEPVETREGGPRGGLCVVEGRRVLLLDVAASLPDRLGVLVEVLCREDTGPVYLPPAVRERLNRARREGV